MRVVLFSILVLMLCCITMSVMSQETAAQGTVLGYVDDTAEGKRSIAASGHCVEFSAPETLKFVEEVSIFASRYGLPEAPDEDFHIYILNGKKQVLADVPVPYGAVERADLKWYTFPTPAVEVTPKFFVALSFNPHQTKGIYLGFDKNVDTTHSYTGLPDSGFESVRDRFDWMVRVRMTTVPSQGKKVMLLSDWKEPVQQDAFSGCLELKYDDTQSDGMRSYGGRGPAIRYTLSDFPDVAALQKPLMLKGFKVYGSRYGSGYDTQKTMIKVSLVDSSGTEYAKEEIPYGLFSYKEKWVELVFPSPLTVTTANEGYLMVAIDPEAHQYKGIYFHFNEAPQVSHSFVGKAGAEFKPDAEHEWMIRAYLVK